MAPPSSRVWQSLSRNSNTSSSRPSHRLLTIAAATTLTLATATTTAYYLLQRLRKRKQQLLELANNNKSGTGLRSRLYKGKVYHTRFHPTHHKFGYTIFYAYIDLDELPVLLDTLWPLASSTTTALARFDVRDHLKGVGDETQPLAIRVRDLVEEKIGKRPKGPICLLTHLTYLGYCFNPVSFYYIWDEKGEELETVVAEVSNTPWLEQYCYVLDPRNKREVKARRHGVDGWNYIFQKRFHVSPFMDLEHVYDWDFTPPRERLMVSTTMVKGTEQWFNALMHLNAIPFTAMGLMECCLRWPLLTQTVQFLIHYQAFHLWRKRVPFFPHPEGEE